MKKRYFALGIIAGICTIGIIGAALDQGTVPSPTDKPLASAKVKNSEKITKAEFEQLKTGMTYEEVFNIVGGSGELTSETGSVEEGLHIASYSFSGSGSLGANAILMFTNGKLESKAQAGLK